MRLYPVAIALVLLSACSSERVAKNQVAASFHLEEVPPDHKVDLSQRKVFPYSIVPGGTSSAAEVKERVGSDPVVKDHYRGVQLDKLKPFRLAQPAQGYVSYRVGNRVFWTSRKLYLKPGEMVLTDGVCLIRGRCGNRVSLTPQFPTIPIGEPTAAALDLPSYDLPGYPAFAKAAELSVFRMAENAPQPFAGMTARIPESAFTVAPAITGLGMIGGGLPGGLPGTGKDGGLVLQNTPVWLIGVPTTILENPTFQLPPLSPVTVSVGVLPPGLTTISPIGINTPPVQVFELPSLTGSVITIPAFLPPSYSITTIQPNNPSPPFVVPSPEGPVGPGVITQPGGSTNPPDSGNPPSGPGTPPSTPQIEEPPAFEPIPEPKTLGLVGLAVACFVLLKRRP